MVTFTKEDKNIVIPNSLGNFSTGSGGSGVTPEDVEIMIDQAIDTYDEGIQEQFNSTNTAVSGNTENIEAISAETQSIANDLDSLGNSVENLSAVTSGIATDLETLSANTTVVSWEQSLSAGTQIGQITINGQSQSVFAPEGGAEPNTYFVDIDNINNYSGTVNEIYHKLKSGETIFVGIKQDYAYYPVIEASVYEYQEGQSGDPDYLRQEGFSVKGVRADGADGYVIKYGDIRAFRYEGRDGDGYAGGMSVSYSYSGGGGASDAVIYDYTYLDHLAKAEMQAIYNEISGYVADKRAVFIHKVKSNKTEYWYILYQYNAYAAYFNCYGYDKHIHTLQIEADGDFIGNEELILPNASSSRLGGIKVGSGLTINSAGVLSVDGGGGDSKTIVNIDALSQSELVDLYNTFSGATSADSINEHYEFYCTFYDSPYGLTEGPIRLQFLYPQGSCVTFGASCYDGQYQNIVAYSVRLNSNGTYDGYFDKIDKTFGLETQRIFRDYWYVYYDTTTSGFSYGVDQELTPITWGTGTTCSGEWIFDRDSIYQYLGSPIKSERALYFNLRVKTAEGTRIYGYPSFSRVVLDTPITFTNEQGESVSFTDKVYFDYGDCVLSFYFENNWRFGGMQITFR